MSATASRPPIETPQHVAVVVEDSPEFEQLILESLASLDGSWSIRSYGLGAEAMDAIRDTLPRADLVLVDIGLPDLSGIEVIRAARERFPDVPIMVISVFSSSDAVLEAIQCGARGYLQKGDSALSLSQGIQGVLAGQYPISPSLAHYLFRLVQADAPVIRRSQSPLSAREIELLRLLANGHTYEEAAERMTITLSTAQTFSKRIFLKLEVTRKSDAIAAAREYGIIP